VPAHFLTLSTLLSLLIQELLPQLAILIYELVKDYKQHGNRAGKLAIEKEKLRTKRLLLYKHQAYK
jgi:hypothetical protein